MKTKKLISAILAASTLAAMSSIAVLPVSAMAADAAMPMQRDRLVVQISDGDSKRWNLALNNIKNVQAAVGADKVDIELVAFGPGVNMLKAEAEVANRVQDAAAAGVKIVACENTLRALKLSHDDMNASIGYVPAGAVELMRKQAEGWSYLRP